jgi:hypothetical protein
VHRDALFGVEIQMRKDGVIGVHVLGLHEPAGFVGSDRKQTEVHFSASFLDHFKVRPVARVSGKEDFLGRERDDVSSPKGFVSVTDSTSRPVLGWHELNVVIRLPPVELDDGLNSRLSEQRGVAQRNDEFRVESFLKLHERGEVEVIVVIVTDHDRVDCGECRNFERGLSAPGRSGKTNGASAMTELRIRKDTLEAILKVERGVPDERHMDAGGASGRDECRSSSVRNFALGPGSWCRTDFPLEDIPERLGVVGSPGVVEALAVKMVGWRIGLSARHAAASSLSEQGERKEDVDDLTAGERRPGPEACGCRAELGVSGGHLAIEFNWPTSVWIEESENGNKSGLSNT